MDEWEAGRVKGRKARLFWMRGIWQGEKKEDKSTVDEREAGRV